MAKCKSFSKIEPHKFLQIKNSQSHAKKNSAKSNVEILRKVVNRQRYRETIHGLDDPCVIYDIISNGF